MLRALSGAAGQGRSQRPRLTRPPSSNPRRLLETVPEGALSAARRVVQELGDDDEAAAVETASAAEAERLRKLL